MKKKLKYFIIIFGIVAASLAAAYMNQSNLNPVSHAAVKVVLNQNRDYGLSLRSVSSENSYFSDYKLEKPFGYYNVKILDKNDTELFSGKVEKNRVTFPPYQVGDDEIAEEPKLIFEPHSELSLLLPYYKNAEKIILTDENNAEKFSINISNLSLPDDYSANFCGNGICDSNESIFFCYNDCRPQ